LVNIILLLAIIPLLSKMLVDRFGMSSTRRDLLLSQSSVLVLVAGSIFIAGSPTISMTILGLIIWTLGTGFTALTRSLITTLVDKQHVGRLYAAISIVETVGALLAGPMLNGLYTVGLKKGGGWIGLPFYGLAVICGIGSVGVWGFSFSSKGRTNAYEPVLGEGYLDSLEDVETFHDDLIPLEPTEPERELDR
jgi:MFS family permease